MNENPLIIKCTRCGSRNRVPEDRLKDSPKCGKCGVPLPDRIFDRPVTVNDADFSREVLASPFPVLVDCWAPWCGPCRSIAPIMDELARKYRGRLKIAKLNVDENPGTGSRYAIQSIPTLLLIQKGQVVDRLVGAQPKEALEAQIARIL